MLRGVINATKTKIIFLITILIFILFISFPIKAADCGGSIQCECGDTLVESQTMWYSLYTCTYHGLIIGADDITLDCNGHIIDRCPCPNQLHYGVNIEGRENVVIKNCNIQEFYHGIYLGSSSNNNIFDNHIYNGLFTTYSSGIALSNNAENNFLINNTIYNNGGNGVLFSNSNNNSLINNTIMDNNLYGIRFDYNSHNNTLINNSINNNDYGVRLYFSSSNKISENRFNDNNYGIYFQYSSSFNTLWSNTFIDNNVNAYETVGVINNWNITNLGNYWDDFGSNPGYPNYYEISGSGSGVDWHPILTSFPNVWVDLTPIGNTIFPASGGTLYYGIEGGNNEIYSVELDIWIDVTLPDGSTYGPLVGPVMNFEMPVGFSIARDRELNIPSTAPYGTYTLNGYFGEYDNANPIIWAEDHFEFSKEGETGETITIEDVKESFLKRLWNTLTSTNKIAGKVIGLHFIL